MTEQSLNRNHVILVVDDDRPVLEAISAQLDACGYTVITCHNAQEAIDKYQSSDIDVILTDIKMPGFSGIELAERIHALNADVPIILITAYADIKTAVDAIHGGAFDFITKPYKFDYLKDSVKKAIRFTEMVRHEKDYKRILEEEVRHKTKSLSDMSREFIVRLTTVAEFRDEDTGAHISRIGLYAKEISETLGMPFDFIDRISLAGSLHDIGKVGIPDSILLKPGPLTKYEFEIMKTHTTLGAKVFAGSTHPTIQLAESIALNHHERWDGKGYPRGLQGDAIPIEGSIIMLVDQYDALRSKRPYKPAFDHEAAYKIITTGDSRTAPTQFSPAVLNAFIKKEKIFNDIFGVNQDQLQL